MLTIVGRGWRVIRRMVISTPLIALVFGALKDCRIRKSMVNAFLRALEIQDKLSLALSQTVNT